MWQAWTTVVQAANPYLESLTTETLTTHMLVVINHAQQHCAHTLAQRFAIHQHVGHANLESFVGAIGREAPYAPQ